MTAEAPAEARELVLTDEELTVLVPDASPVPHLARLSDEAAAVALSTAARSLLVRGVAVHEAGEVVAATGLRHLVRPLMDRRERLELACPLPGAPDALTVVRPSGRQLHVQDVGVDGVHVLSSSTRSEAAVRLRRLLDPCGLADSAAPGHTSPPDLAAAEAAVRLQRIDGGAAPLQDVLVVTADGGCWLLESGASPQRLGRTALDALVTQLLDLPDGSAA